MFSDLMSKYFTKQKMMRTVIISLIPIILAATYYFGFRVLLLLLVVNLFGVGTEYIYEKKNKKKVSEAVLVTGILYTLTLPPSTPYWIAVVGIIFAVLFGKMVFGGFGKNIFNPALVGRAFIYVSFPEPLTISWTKVSTGFPGGFISYLNQGVEAVSSATPMLAFRDSGTMLPPLELLIGKISGSIGETSAILIILAGIYLLYTKVAAWQTMAGCLSGFLGLSTVLYLSGVSQVPNPIYGLLSGGFLFATVYMATDPISSARTKGGKWIYGIIIGVVTVIIRGYALFAGGVMFAILIGNTFAPIIDEAINAYKRNKKEKAENKEEVTV
ncbi:MAG: RnfABCDGE type electron transport complex subunit D [Gudongella sp.]|nr:RnfABCDGE type electron transport complex subunit D [Gudongella sp.]